MHSPIDSTRTSSQPAMDKFENEVNRWKSNYGRYQLVHIGIWFILFVFILIMVRPGYLEVLLPRYVAFQFVLVLITAGLFYANYLVIIPRNIINHTNYIRYALFTLLSISVSSILVIVVSEIMLPYVNGKSPFLLKFISNHVTGAIVAIIALSMRIFVDNHNRKNKMLEHERVVHGYELKFLKARINPHFLHNSFNTIYSLAESKSPHTAQATLELSIIMRYLTEKSAMEQTSIHNELDFLESYFSFLKLRIHDPMNSKINIDIVRPKSEFMISPLLLLSFAENAFKHSNIHAPEAVIDVSFKPISCGFEYRVYNTVGIDHTISSGVGSDSLQRILEMIYPEQHHLTFEKTLGGFTAFMSLNSLNDKVGLYSNRR